MNPKKSLNRVPAVPVITNVQVEQILALRETQRSLKDRLKLMDDAIDKAESDLIAQIGSGADLSACGYAVEVQTTERRYPAWKEHFISKLGKNAADQVMADTAPVAHRRVVIK